MAILPTGIVTFLLTDIESSTRRWDREPDAMQAALIQHDALFQRAIDDHDGVVVKPRGEGDSRFSVFPRASDAVAAAAKFQHAVFTTEWLTELPLRVRVAAHTGEATLRDGDYYGSTVNRCARLRSLAWGGQTLVSLATEELVRENLPSGVTLRDLGQHRLKDLSWPEHVFQLVIPGIPDEFSPLLSLDQNPTNLPVQATAFIGRELEIEQIRNRLLAPATRLVTLTGPGGSGKTRLGLQVAASVVEEFTDGVFLVPFESVLESSLVIQSIVEAIGVRETSGVTLIDNLNEHLRSKSLLLVLDNFERIVRAGPQLSALLAVNPRLKILVTSREALRVRGEQAIPVPPLGLPDDGTYLSPERLMKYESISLFVSRATDVKPDFELTPENAAAVVRICQRLDGLPLAIELAAARVRLFTPQALLKRLDRTLALLTGGARDLPVRQQTLRATIAWSYDLLDADEQAFFRKLSVFAGGFTLDGVIAVTNVALPQSSDEIGNDEGTDHWTKSIAILDAIDALLSKSLVQHLSAPGDEDDPRFGMLETIREFGLEQLEVTGERSIVRGSHARYFLALSEMAEPELQGPEQGIWLERLEADHRNLRLAMTCALETSDAELGLRLTSALWPFWEVRGYFTEGGNWTERMLVLGGAPRLRAKTLTGAGTMAWSQGDYERATAFHSEALDLFRELGDQSGIAFSLSNLGLQAVAKDDLNEATRLFDQAEAQYRKIENQSGIADVLNNLAIVAFYQDDIDRAAGLVEQSLKIRRVLGDKQRIADALYNLGEFAYYRNDCHEAAALYRESLSLRRELGARSGAALCLAALAGIASAQGQPERGARLCGAAEKLFETTGISMDSSERARYEQVAHTLRVELGNATYAVLREEGRGFSVEQAIDFALDGTGSQAVLDDAGEQPMLRSSSRSGDVSPK